MSSDVNRRILLVDDTPAIHEDFRKVLVTPAASSKLDADEAILFGTAPKARTLSFELDSALQGVAALGKVETACREGRPFALAFIDVRMPPGWDGVETIERLWAVDQKLQVVLCTAYSDYSWPEVLSRLDVRDRLLILKKPFDPIEVYQFASALTTKWTLAEQAAFKMSRLEEAVEARTRELSDAYIVVQNSPVILYRLGGQPELPLLYVSRNVTRFGYQPAALVGSADWARRLIHPDDRAQAGEAMARIFEKGAESSSIEFRVLTADGTLRWVENRYSPVRDSDGRLMEIEGIVIDITERKAADEQIARLARTDALTGLANRATFLERLEQAFAAARRGGASFAVLYLDLDRFKPVNDTFGHAVGDLLLQRVAGRLRECSRETDLIARLGGDEFALLQTDIREVANAGELAQKIQVAITRPFVLHDNPVQISLSIGICPFAADIGDAASMLVQADLALYRSKEEGRNQYRFHSSELDQEVRERVTLGAELRAAIDRNELTLDYQAQVDLSSRRIVGMEALVRWNHPTRGVLLPNAFLPVAERTGAIVPLGRWVLDRACRQLSQWRQEGIGPEVIAVNVSLSQLKRGADFVAEVLEIVSRWQLQAAEIEFDVTEGTLAQLKWTRNDVLPRLRKLGIKIAIDDFGSEYSSFDYVKAFSVNHLKVSRSYISKSERDPEGAAAVAAIFNYARDIGVGVIAQGVETEQQFQLLNSAAPGSQAQGFHFSAAVNAEEAGRLLALGHIPATSRVADAPICAADMRLGARAAGR